MNTKNNAHETTLKTFLLWPFILTIGIILVDQATKWMIQRNISILFTGDNDTIRIWGDFLWIIHVNNKGALFSLGSNLSPIFHKILLIIIPLLLLVWLCVLVAYSNLQKSYRILTATILGGGMSNMLDRVFREHGVVDWISVKFYGFLGFARWPTFNLADASIVISIIIWITITVGYEIKYRTHKNLPHNHEKETGKP